MACNFIFGYGSLVHRQQASLYLPDQAEENAIQYCCLTGYRRTWNVAMNNSISIPGYKYYLHAGTGKRPACFVTFLNIEEAADEAIFGILFKVTPEKLAVIDARERNYKRINITQNLNIRVNGAAWTYKGLEQAENRFQQGLRRQCAVISQDYFNLVSQAYASLGSGHLADYLANTIIPPIPQVKLIRKQL